MAVILEARVEQKTDTEANWLVNPLILLAGECAYVLGPDSITPINFKIGDGSKTFAELPYWINYAANVVVPTVPPGSTLPNPGAAGKLIVLAAGNYTNIGGGTSPIVAAANAFNMGYWNGTTWSLVLSVPVTADLSNYISVDANGLAYGAMVPDIQYKHVRGDTEIAGNSTYTNASTYGLSMYEPMTKAIVVNQVQAPVWGGIDSAVTFRIYKNSSVIGTPATMTFLEEVLIPAGSFNTLSTALQTINLTGSYKIASGQYVFVYFFLTAGTKLSFKDWNALFGGSPERHAFYYLNSASNPFTSTWSASAAGLYQSSFILLQKNPSIIALEAAVALITANGVVADANHQITGVKLPTTQWIHARGDAEMVGNTQYGPTTTNYGICYYEQLTNKVVISSIIANIWTQAADAAVTIRAYTSTSFTNVIASQTLLEEKIYTAGQFNTAVATPFEILLTGTYYIQANSYVYLYVYWASGTTTQKLGSRYWNALFGSAPERHTFLFLGAATGWGSNWTVASSPFYQTALKFKYRNEAEQDLTARVGVLELNKAFNPRIALPSIINVAIGRELNIWNDALSVSYGSDVKVTWISAAGTNFKTKERGLRYTPTVVESNTVTVYIRNRNNVVLGQKTITINGVSKTIGTGTLQIVCIGDSTTLGSGASIAAPYPTELKNLITTDGGPTPLLLGTQGTPPNRHEGRGGWLWSNYLNAGPGSGNAFWDAANSRNDFQKWMLNNSNFTGTNKVDIASIMLGINDVVNSLTVGASYITTAVNNAKTFVTALLDPTYGYPTCKVIINLPAIASNTKDAWALDYPNYDKDTYEYNMRSYYEQMLAAFDGGAFAANVYIIGTGMWIDRNYGYAKANVNVSQRNTTQVAEFKSASSVHPYDDGYYQISDSVYSQIRYILSLTT